MFLINDVHPMEGVEIVYRKKGDICVYTYIFALIM